MGCLPVASPRDFGDPTLLGEAAVGCVFKGPPRWECLACRPPATPGFRVALLPFTEMRPRFISPFPVSVGNRW